MGNLTKKRVEEGELKSIFVWANRLRSEELDLPIRKCPSTRPIPTLFRYGFSLTSSTGAGAIIRKSILPFKIPEHQKTFLFCELCFVWALV
jgi:hypothetical protein